MISSSPHTDEPTSSYFSLVVVNVYQLNKEEREREGEIERERENILKNKRIKNKMNSFRTVYIYIVTIANV